MSKQETVMIEGKCANCACWRPVDIVGAGPVTIGGPKRGLCFALPPVPALVEDRRTGMAGQRNLRAQTTESEGCLAFFAPRPDLVEAAAAGKRGGN